MKKRLPILILLLLAGGLSALLSLPKTASLKTEPSKNSETPAGSAASFDSNSDLDSSSNLKTNLQHKTGAAAASNATGQSVLGSAPRDEKKDEEERKAVFERHQYKEQLAQYESLAKKVLRPEDENAWLKKWQQDPRFVESLKTLLVTPAQSAEELSMQDTAIEALMESLKGEPQGPAVEVLNAVVSNSLVEDSSIPQPLRENLAGVKGEIMIKWIGSVPGEEGQMAGRLPGPVSQKVWKNVLAMKENNLKESSTLKK